MPIPNLLEMYTKSREGLMPQQQQTQTSDLMRLAISQQRSQFQQKQKQQQEARTKSDKVVAGYRRTLDGLIDAGDTKRAFAFFELVTGRTEAGAATAMSTGGTSAFKTEYETRLQGITPAAFEQRETLDIARKTERTFAMKKSKEQLELQARREKGDAWYKDATTGELVRATPDIPDSEIEPVDVVKKEQQAEMDFKGMNFEYALDFRHMIQRDMSPVEQMEFMESSDSRFGRSGFTFPKYIEAFMGHGDRRLKNAQRADMWRLLLGDIDDAEEEAILASLKRGETISVMDPDTGERIEVDVPSPFYFIAQWHLGALALPKKKKGFFEKIFTFFDEEGQKAYKKVVSDAMKKTEKKPEKDNLTQILDRIKLNPSSADALSREELLFLFKESRK